MSYKGEQLNQKRATDRPSIGNQAVTYTLVGTLAASFVPHVVECITRDAPGGLVCESKAPARHDLHIESAPNSSNTSTGVQGFTLVAPTGAPSLADVLDWLNRPRI